MAAPKGRHLYIRVHQPTYKGRPIALQTLALLMSRLLPEVLVMKLAVTAFFQALGTATNL